jgi:PAS domain S-box-containing protein
MANTAGLISYLGTWVQLGGILLLLTLFRLLARHAGTRSYFVIWARAWLVLLVAIAAILLRYALAPGLNPALLSEGSRPVTLMYLAYQLAKLWHLGLLVSGSVEYCKGRRFPGNSLPWAAGIGLYAALSVVYSSDLNRVVFWQGLLAVPALATCAVLFLTLPRARRTLGTRVTGGTFGALALLWLGYVVAFGGVRRVAGVIVDTPLNRLALFNSYFDVVLALLLGYGMVVLLLEDSRRETEQARAARLRDVAASEARLAGLVGAATEAIVTLDDGQLIGVFNPAAEQIFGRNALDTVGTPFRNLVHPRGWSQVESLLTVGEGSSSRGATATMVPGLRADGSEVPLELSVSTLRLADSTMRILMLRDINDRLAAEAEREELKGRLSQSLRMEAVGRLVSGVAHELNNPLAAILTFSEDLLRDPPPALPTEPLVVIRDQAQRARAIVRDLLAFVRRREERREVIVPRELIERVANALRRDFERNEVELVLDVRSELPNVIGDAVGLEQVITNLLDNALRATPRQGLVTVRGRTVREGLEVLVEDTGPGIAADILPRIFEPFFTTRAAGQGTGLGLSVSLGIVEQHGGQLTAENQPGAQRGARFRVLLPFGTAAADRRLTPRAAPIAAGNAVDAMPKVPPGRTPRVLIIDDESAVRAAMRRFFERKGWKVEEADDGAPGLAAALQAPDNQPYDIIISDLKMPGMSGIALHDGLMAAKPALLQRLVIATGDTASPEAAAFLRKTRCAILEKPFALDDLARIVDQVMPGGSSR